MKVISIYLLTTLFLISGTVKERLTNFWLFETVIDKTMKADELQFINAMFKSASLDLREDGTQTFALMGKVDVGTWDVSENNDAVVFIAANGDREEAEIIELTEESLSLRIEDKFVLKFKKATSEEKEEQTVEIQEAVDKEVEKKSEFEEMKSDFVSASTAQVSKKWMMDGRDPKKGSSAEASELAKLLMEGSYLHFKPNGKYKLKVLGIKEKGTWSLENNRTQIVTRIPDGKNVWNIEKVESNKLVLVKNNDPRRWYFIIK